MIGRKELSHTEAFDCARKTLSFLDEIDRLNSDLRGAGRVWDSMGGFVSCRVTAEGGQIIRRILQDNLETAKAKSAEERSFAGQGFNRARLAIAIAGLDSLAQQGGR